MGEASTSVSSVPGWIGPNQVLGFLAAGGMSEIFLGREPSGRPVVIKRILPHLARQRSFVSMFLDEARIGSMIRHPNVVEVYELGQVGVELFITMEMLEGENASSLIRRMVSRGERLPYALAAHIVAEACKGLHAAHTLVDEHGQPLRLVHRDVSPQNLFVTYGGAVKVLDFGIATATHRLAHTATGQLKGKFAYMSPEQCRGEPLDARSDVFSLGIVLCELAMQRRLFARANELLVLKAVCEDPIPRPSRALADFPPFLEDIIVRALARDPDQRYPSAQAMYEDLAVAIQFLHGPGDPGAVLGGAMTRLFDDRVAIKRSMLTHLRAGTDPGLLPSTEVDESVVVPAAQEYAPAPTPTGAPIAAPAVTPPARARRRWIAGVLVGAVVAGAAAVGLGLAHRRGARPADAAPPPAAMSAPAPAPVAPPAPRAPTAPPAPTAVVVHIETTPAGAAVRVDGVDRGETPLDLRLPIGGAPVALELRRRGYVTVRQTVQPDVDQRLIVPLHHRARKPAADDGGGFHRFD